MPRVTTRCETAEELFAGMAQDCIEATCTAEEKVQAAKALVKFCTHPEVNPQSLSLPEEPEPPTEPEPPPEEIRALARQYGLR